MNLIMDILENKKSVRALIDEAVVDDAAVDDASAEPVSDDGEYRHLFVRRWRKDADKPYKRTKLQSAAEALNLYFNWADKYKQDRVEIWTDVAQDAKNFYRFCLKNREMLEPMWKMSPRVRRAGVLWPAAYKDIQARSRQSGANVLGTLYPFEADVK